jgi:hypothetical protein
VYELKQKRTKPHHSISSFSQHPTPSPTNPRLPPPPTITHHHHHYHLLVAADLDNGHGYARPHLPGLAMQAQVDFPTFLRINVYKEATMLDFIHDHTMLTDMKRNDIRQKLSLLRSRSWRIESTTHQPHF